MTAKFDVCVLWPSNSKISNTGASAVGCVCCGKWSNHCSKISLCIHPLGWAAAWQSGGALSSRSAFILQRGKTRNGGIKFPDALMQTSTVTRVPRSAELNVPTCFLPLDASTLDGLFGTVVIPVSSQLNTLSGVKWNLFCSSSSKSKNLPTTTLLNPCARAAEVASAIWRARSLCLAINPRYGAGLFLQTWITPPESGSCSYAFTSSKQCLWKQVLCCR